MNPAWRRGRQNMQSTDQTGWSAPATAPWNPLSRQGLCLAGTSPPVGLRVQSSRSGVSQYDLH